MNALFAAAKIFPFWGIPCVMILFELGQHFRRKKKLPLQLLAYFLCLLVTAAVLLWFIFRGDLNSEVWVRNFLGQK